MDVTNLIIQLQARGDGAEVIEKKLMAIGYTAKEVSQRFTEFGLAQANIAKKASSAMEEAKSAAEGLYKSANAASDIQISRMGTLVERIQAETRMLREAQNAFGTYSPEALSFSQEMFRPSPTLQANSFQDVVLGSGTSEEVAKTNAETRAYRQTLSELVIAEGGVTDRVLKLADAFETSIPAIERFRASQAKAVEDAKALRAEISMPWVAPIGPVREEFGAPIGPPDPNAAQRAAMEASNILGSGGYASLQAQIEQNREYQRVLAQLVESLGPADAAVRRYSEAFSVTTPAIEAYDKAQRLAADSNLQYARFLQAELAPLREQEALLRTETELFERQMAVQRSNSQFVGPATNMGFSPTKEEAVPLTPPSDMDQARMRFNSMFGPDSIQQIEAQNAAMRANKSVLAEVAAQGAAGEAQAKQWASAMGVESEATVRGTSSISGFASAAGSAEKNFGQFVRGMAAGFLQFSLLAGAFVLAGRAVAEFTSGSIEKFHALELEAQNLSTVQVGLDVTQAEASLQRLEAEVPAALKDIETSYYEVASVGSQTAQVSEQHTAQITTGAKTARADVKTWTDDVIGSMNQFQLWGETADQTYSNAQNVQAKFFQAAKDSIGTPAQLAQAWGPVALAVQQAGGSMDDALALMVGASKGAGDFEQNMTTVYRFLNELNTEKAQRSLQDFGIAVQDNTTGKIRPAIDILEQIHEKIKSFPLAEQTSIINQLFPEQRATRGAETLINNIDTIKAEYPKLGDAAKTFDQAQNSYLDTETTKWALINGSINSFWQSLGRKIDPINILVNFVQTGLKSGPRTSFLDDLDPTKPGSNLLLDFVSRIGTSVGATPLEGSIDWYKAQQEGAAQTAQSAQVMSHSASEFKETWGHAMEGAASETHKFLGAVREDSTTIPDMLKSSAEQTIAGYAGAFKTGLLSQIGKGIVQDTFGTIPTDMQAVFANAATYAQSSITSNFQKVIDTLADYAGQAQYLVNEIANPHTDSSTKAADQATLLKLLQDAGKYTQDNQATLDPKAYEARQKNIANIQAEIEKTNALAGSADNLRTAEQRVADATAHWSALIQVQRDLVSGLRSDLSGATELWSTLGSEAKDALSLGGTSFYTFKSTTGPSEISDWVKSTLSGIEATKQNQLSDLKSQDLSASEYLARSSAVIDAADKESKQVIAAGEAMKKSLAALPEGLGNAASQFEDQITSLKNKIVDLQHTVDAGTAELTRRQRVLQDNLGGAQGLAGPFQLSESDLGSQTPGFLSDLPGQLSAAAGGASATTETIERLRRMIEDPVSGSGFLTQFLQALSDARAKLREDQAAAQDFRDSIANQQFNLGTQQYDLTSRENASSRPMQDEQFALSQQLFAERQAETAQMRPLNEELYQYNLLLGDEQDRMRSINRTFSAELLPLQREYNQLQREQNEIQQQTELQNMAQNLDNQTATLARLTPGTAQYLAVRQGLVKTEADYALKAREYSLQDKIAQITEERDAAVQAEQAKIDALDDVVRAKTRERDADQHQWDLERQSIQDQVDRLGNQEAVAQHNFELEQRRISDEKAALDEKLRLFNQAETIQEKGDQRLIDLASLEVTMETRRGQAWAGAQELINRGNATALADFQRQLTDTSTAYDTWKTTTLKPVQDKVDAILKSGGKSLKDGFDKAIKTINGPGGVITGLEALASEAEASGKRQEDAIKKADEALKLYYTHLDQTSRLEAAMSQGNTGIAPPLATEPGVIPTVDKTPPNPHPGVSKARGGWVGLNGPEYTLLGEEGAEFVIPHPLVESLAQMFSGGTPYGDIDPVTGGGSYSKGGGAFDLSEVFAKISAYAPAHNVYSPALTIQPGAIVFQSNSNFNNQSEADRAGRMIVRSLTSFLGINGSPDGWGGS